MEPYTAEGMAWREAQSTSSSSSSSRITDGPSLSRQPSVVVDSPTDTKPTSATPTKTALDGDANSAVEMDSIRGGLCVAAAASSAAVSVSHINYELVGIVVHSGQANAGHYYSFIKDRRSV